MRLSVCVCTAPGCARRCRICVYRLIKEPMSDLTSPPSPRPMLSAGAVSELYFEDAPLHRTHHGGILPLFQGLSSAAALPSHRCGACRRPCRGADTAAPRAWPDLMMSRLAARTAQARCRRRCVVRAGRCYRPSDVRPARRPHTHRHMR